MHLPSGKPNKHEDMRDMPSSTNADHDGRYYTKVKTRAMFNKAMFIFDDIIERDAFFTLYPELLLTDILIVIKDTTPPPTIGIRMLNFSKSYNSQYLSLLYP